MNTEFNLVTERIFKDELERRIDKKGLNTILMQLVEICHEKASHVDENWQDSKLATQWTKTANKLDNYRLALENVCPSF